MSVGRKDSRGGGGRRLAVAVAVALAGTVSGGLFGGPAPAEGATSGSQALAGNVVLPANVSPQPSDHLYANLYDGVLSGYISPGAAYTAQLLHGTVVKAVASGTADGAGHYATSLSYDAGHGPGIHNGDTVVLSSGSTVWRQPVQLAGYLDEMTGQLSGTARPKASVAVALYTNSNLAHLAWDGYVTADSTGKFQIQFGRLLKPVGPSSWPWRGYQAFLTGRDIHGQALFTKVQTPNTTLDITKNLAGGGYFNPGDSVTFSLLRGGITVSQVTTQADQDGVPQATFPVDVMTGDVLQTSYHDASGHARSQTLDPWRLTALIDPASETVTGVTEPGAAVVAEYYTKTGVQSAETTADTVGSYTIGLGAAGIPYAGGDRVVVWRSADPGYLGVGAQQIDATTPVLGLNDVNTTVSGYGPPAVEPVSVTVTRNGTVIGVASGTTSKDGGFVNLTLPTEVVPGDVLTATAGSQPLPAFNVGSMSLVAHLLPGTGPLTYAGSGQPGRVVSVTVSGSASCVATATVGATGTWQAALPCQPALNSAVQVMETASSGSDGTAVGDTRWRFQWLTQPDLSLAAPTPLGQTSSNLTLEADSFSIYDNLPPSAVWFFVDGTTWLQAQAGSGQQFTTTISMAPGPHTVAAYAFDALGRLDAQGNKIYAVTATRQFTVAA